MRAAAAASIVLLTACSGTAETWPERGATEAGAPAGAVAPQQTEPIDRPPVADRAADRTLPGEEHLRNVRQMTFGGQNAEAYWSWDDRALTLQITNDETGCDQIFVMDAASGELTQITSRGRTTCAFFLPGDERLLYASTHESSAGCPPEPDRSQGYVWPVFSAYEIYTAARDGSDLRNITNRPGYDAEATVAADGRIVFTSDRSGDLELWTMDAEGNDLHQLTHTPGYDGGAFFSPDGTKLLWRASRPRPGPEQDEYFDLLLNRHMVRPSRLEIFVADADGSNVVQVTNNGKANFAPYFSPDSGSILFASNMADPRGRRFEIWKIDVDGGNLERVTYDDSGFNGFPMFSHDGNRLVFSSNRFGSVPHETNVFIADWAP